MTRKQAVLRAIEELSKNEENTEAVSILKEIYTELPLVRWTKNNVLDSVTQYLNEHNNIFPTKKEFMNTLPTVGIVKRLFKLSSIEEFRDIYFPQSRESIKTIYALYTEEDFLNVFIESYNKINGGAYVRSKDYDLLRDASTPSLSTIIRNTCSRSYPDLLHKAGIKKKPKPLSISANRNTDINEVNVAIKEYESFVHKG